VSPLSGTATQDDERSVDKEAATATSSSDWAPPAETTQRSESSVPAKFFVSLSRRSSGRVVAAASRHIDFLSLFGRAQLLYRGRCSACWSTIYSRAQHKERNRPKQGGGGGVGVRL